MLLVVKCGHPSLFLASRYNRSKNFDQNYLLSMQAQTSQPSPRDPFEIIYNFRSAPSPRQKPKRKASACERLQTITDYTIRTRKMTAQTEIKEFLCPQTTLFNHQEMVEEIDLLKMEDPPSFFLKAEDDLQNAIPFNQENSKDMLFDLEENSYASNYSKLERTLLGFSSKEGQMEEERE